MGGLGALPVQSDIPGLHPESAKGRPEMSDVIPLSGILELSFDSSFLSPLLLFCLVLLLVIFLLMVHSPDFPPRKLPDIIREELESFCMVLVEQLGDESW